VVGVNRAVEAGGGVRGDSYVEQIQGAKLQAFAQLVDDPRWYGMTNTDLAVRILKRRMEDFGAGAKKRWMAQNFQAVRAELDKLNKQQEGR